MTGNGVVFSLSQIYLIVCILICLSFKTIFMLPSLNYVNIFRCNKKENQIIFWRVNQILARLFHNVFNISIWFNMVFCLTIFLNETIMMSLFIAATVSHYFYIFFFILDVLFTLFKWNKYRIEQTSEQFWRENGGLLCAPVFINFCLLILMFFFIIYLFKKRMFFVLIVL